MLALASPHHPHHLGTVFSWPARITRIISRLDVGLASQHHPHHLEAASWQLLALASPHHLHHFEAVGACPLASPHHPHHLEATSGQLARPYHPHHLEAGSGQLAHPGQTVSPTSSWGSIWAACSPWPARITRITRIILRLLVGQHFSGQPASPASSGDRILRLDLGRITRIILRQHGACLASPHHPHHLETGCRQLACLASPHHLHHFDAVWGQHSACSPGQPASSACSPLPARITCIILRLWGLVPWPARITRIISRLHLGSLLDRITRIILRLDLGSLLTLARPYHPHHLGARSGRLARPGPPASPASPASF